MHKIYSILFLSFCWINVLNAQDIHFSQFYNSPLNLNPALTGVFKGDQRFMGNFRQQWQSVPVPYTTFSAAYDQKVPLKFLEKGTLGIGGVFNHDNAGDGDLIWNQLALNIAYTHPLTKQAFLSAGFQLMTGSRSIQPNQLTWAEQWNGDIFDPSQAHTEDFITENKGFFSLSGGWNAHFQSPDSRTKFDLGMGVFHLNEPDISFLNTLNVRLPAKGNIYGIGTLEIHPKMDIRFFGTFFIQTEYEEVVFGTALRYHVSLQRSREISVQIGSNVRLGDALIPTLEVQYQAWRVGLSYDVNTSDFQAATRRMGGPELAIEYIITKVKPVKVFKACPIF